MEINKYYTLKELLSFYENYDKKHPIVIMFYMVFSLGLYLIYWLYVTNNKLEEIDEEAPDANRGVIILLFLPIVWIVFLRIFKLLIFKEKSTFLITIGAVGWAIIIFLSLQYIYDFCNSFGRLTSSNGLIWYLFIYPGYFSVILIFYDFYYTSALLFFTFFAIPSMQEYINTHAEKCKMKTRAMNFNSMNRSIMK